MAQVSNLLLLYIVAGTIILTSPLLLFFFARFFLRSTKVDSINQEKLSSSETGFGTQSPENTGYFLGGLVVTGILSVVVVLVPLAQGMLRLIRAGTFSEAMLYYLIFTFCILGLLIAYSIRRGLLRWRS